MGKIAEMKKALPYGKYIFKDGTQILFNRFYEVFAEGEFRESASETGLYLKGAKWKWFYDDSNPPWISRDTLTKCQSILKAFDAE